MGTIHKDFVLDGNHAVPVRVYTDIAARDADTAFHSVISNVDKIVRIDSPISYYILTAITPTWTEITSILGVTGPAVSIIDGLATYLDTSGKKLSSPVGIIFNGENMTFGNSIAAKFGDSGDFLIVHGGVNTILANTTGELIIETTDAANLVLRTTNVNASVDVKLGSATASSSFAVHNSTGAEVFHVKADGSVEITSDLHVTLGSSGITPAANSVMTLESPADGFLSILAPDTNSTGILFGNANNSSHAGIHHRSADGRLEFRTGGNLSRMSITDGGNVGIGTTSPQVELHVQHNQNSDTDIEVENTTAGTAANARVIVSADSGALALTAYSSLFTTVGSLMADAAEVRANSSMSAGLNLVAHAPTAPIRFYAGGVNSERMRITGTGPIGMGTTAPDASALLDIKSTTKGFLEPRMIEADLNAIPSPATGLQVYDTVNNIPRIFDGTEWRALTDPTNVIKIASQQDWDSLSATAVITISTPTTLLVATTIVTDKRIDVVGAVNFSLLGNKFADVSIKYTGAGDFITADGTPILRVNGFNNLDGDTTGTFLNISNSTIFVEIASIGASNWADLGTITDCAQFRIPTAGFFLSGAGFKINGVGRTFLKEIAGFNIVSIAGPWFSLNNTPNTPTIAATISENTITLKSSESLIAIDPDIGEDSRIRVNGVIIVEGGALFETGGITGGFTAVTNASFTGVVITLVEDLGNGTAHFHYDHPPGPEIFINQEVTLSGFTTNTNYNGTFIVTAFTTGGAFLVGDVAFGTNEAGGVFASDTVILTETATALSNNDAIVVDTKISTRYDGGATVYNKLVNSFQINKKFFNTADGSWSTAKIDQTDPRVLSFENPGFVDSKYIATAFVNNNTIAVGPITNNVFRRIDFGDFGTALTAGSTIERWKLILDHEGIFEYTGNEPFDGVITFDFTVVSTGGNQDFRFHWHKSTDGGATFNDLIDPAEALVNVGSNPQSVTKTFPLTANKGDQIQPEITRNAGTSGITVTYATIYATQ